ncbi:helix-turn-helix domain-containing protein [Micromonospora sp. NPDC050397]|uniref:helix-turn-helix domain-containing protein n=1 Tax=Micromonospora sp. NPDC050397 TaxID=3364279 RepID=UPI00384C8E0C
MRERSGPAAPRLSLCRQLRAAREATGHTQAAVGDLLGWATSKIMRIEGGQVGVSKTDLRAMLDLYDVQDEEARSQLEENARLVRRQPWGAFRDVLTAQDQTYLSWESSATRLRHYEPLLIPELLRTETYARTVIETFAARTPPQLLRRKWEVLLARQAIIDRDNPPIIHIVLDEAALRRPIRGADDVTAMSDQMTRLRDLARRDTISFHVLPLSMGLFPGLDESVTLLDLPGGESVAYLPRRTRATVTAAHQVSHYDRILTDLAAAALPLSFTRHIEE